MKNSRGFELVAVYMGFEIYENKFGRAKFIGDKDIFTRGRFTIRGTSLQDIINNINDLDKSILNARDNDKVYNWNI